MIASLSMYDWPGQSGHWDIFWTHLRDRLREAGIGAPDALSRGDESDAVWMAPDLVIGQTCGLPYRARLADHVTLIGALDHGLPDCAPGYYHSVVVMRAGDGRGVGDALAGTVAFNAPDSQSGWAALHYLALRHGCGITRAIRTGSHRESARAVAGGRADLAAIDGETWRLIERYDIAVADALRIVERTPPCPGLPLITAGHVDPTPYRDAVKAAVDAVPEPTRAALHIAGFAPISGETYRAMPLPPSPPGH